MRIYYRIQPAGLEIAGHVSEPSEGDATGLHVFSSPHETLQTDVAIEHYGDEIVVIEAPRHWPNGDVEGVEIDAASARVVARISLVRWLARWEELAGNDRAFDNYNDAIERWALEQAQ